VCKILRECLQSFEYVEQKMSDAGANEQKPLQRLRNAYEGIYGTSCNAM
jgi:hypothetical protein